MTSTGQTIHLLSDMRYRRSTDGGVTWTAPRSLATHAINAGLWAGEDGTVAVAWWNRASLQSRVSTNGGRTFRAARVLAPYDEGSGCAAAEPGAVQVLGAGHSLLVSTGQAATILVRSHDGGDTWQDVRLPRFSGVIASDGTTLVATAGYQGDVRISSDGGRTWGDRIAAAPRWIDTLAHTGGRWWALWGSGSQLKAQSSHRGLTWGDRTIIGPQTGWDDDLSTLAGHTVILNGPVIAIRPR